MKQVQNKDNVGPYGRWKITTENIYTGEKKIITKDNLLPTVGREAMAKQITGTNTTDMGDNLYVAAGDDNTAAVITDTTLGNETVRKIAGSAVTSSVDGVITAFFAAGEATGTHQEFGLFGDGNAATASAAADSGIIYSHVIQEVTVSAAETLTLEFTISFDI